MLRASVGVPNRLELETDEPSLPVPGPAEPERDAVASPGFLVAQSGGDFLWDVASECLEDIANLRTHRLPTAGQDWRSARHSEARLLAQVDAIVGCGRTVLGRLEPWALDADIADPDRVFAAAFVLACVREEESGVTAVRILRAAAARDAASGIPAEDGEAPGATEAICLAPHPRVSELVTPLLTDELPGLRAAALTILAYHGSLAHADMMRGLNDLHRDVLAAAAKAAGSCPAPQMRARLEALTRHQDEPTARAAFASSLACGIEGALDVAREYCRQGRPGYADASLWLGLGGRSQDGQLLNELIAGSPDSATIRASAVYGDAGLVPALIGRLAHGESRAEVASTLAWIVGSGPRDTVPVSEYEPGDEEFLDRTPEPAKRPVPSQDAAEWRRWWEQHAREFDTRLRWRNGKPLGPYQVLEALERGPGDPASRRDRHLELRVAAKQAVSPRFDPLDFVPRQEEALTEWRRWVSAQPAVPASGGWLG